jgi:hypothetical protein
MNLKLVLRRDKAAQEASAVQPQSRALAALLCGAFAVAVIIRLLWITAPGMLVEREYTSAIFARTFYFEHVSTVEPWRKAIIATIKNEQPILEPPITEYLVSLIYRAVGHEALWYARYLTAAFWLAGGVVFFLLVRALLSAQAALIATAYYLLVPLGVEISRSFQPDALMMLLYLVSLLLVVRFFNQPSRSRLILAALLVGLTLLVRPLILFGIVGAYTALAIYHKGSLRRAFDRSFFSFIGLGLLLPSTYYGYGILVAGFLRWKVASSFRPYLFLRIEYWGGWFLLATGAVGFTACIAALLGAPLLPKRVLALVGGLVAGYIVFGMAFTFHIHTHDYYHAQLLPVAALCIAPLTEMILERLKRVLPVAWRLPVAAALLVMLVHSVFAVRRSETSQVFESEQTARAIGKLVQHSDNTAFLAYHYGLPLQYYGELAGMYWPRRITSALYRRLDEQERSVEQRFKDLDIRPEYFIITDFSEFERNHDDLAEFLDTHGVLIAKNDAYLVYSLNNLNWDTLLGAQPNTTLAAHSK